MKCLSCLFKLIIPPVYESWIFTMISLVIFGQKCLSSRMWISISWHYNFFFSKNSFELLGDHSTVSDPRATVLLSWPAIPLVVCFTGNHSPAVGSTTHCPHFRINHRLSYLFISPSVTLFPFTTVGIHFSASPSTLSSETPFYSILFPNEAKKFSKKPPKS